MSLQVWLPLNGNLNNQGLADVDFTFSNAAFVSGKIGKCLNLNNTRSNTVTVPALTNCSNYSIAFWYKPVSATYIIHADIITFPSKKGSDTGVVRFESSNTSGTLFNWFNPVGSSSGISKNISATAGTWYHIVLTYDGSKYITYLNGELYHWNNISGEQLQGTMSFGDNGMYGGLNDVRVYDHILSPKEIKELSKGLCLHYKLDDKYIEKTININDNKEGLLYTGTCYNSANRKYGYNDDTDMHYTVGEFQGRKCTKVYVGSLLTETRPYPYFGNITPSKGGYKTLSFDYYPTSQTSLGFYTFRNNATISYKYNGKTGSAANDITIKDIKLNTWNHIEVTFYRSADDTVTYSDGCGYCRLGTIKFASNTDDYWLFSNVQVEKKDHATGFTISKRTDAVAYDSSGFGYNGTVSGIITLSSDSPRYSGSSLIDSATTKIKLPVIDFSDFANNYTFSWWEYGVKLGSMPWGFSDGNRLNLYHYYSGVLCWNTGDGNNNPFVPNINISSLLNAWHHIVVTGDGTTAKLYIDGEYKGSATTYRALTGTQIYISGWDSGTNYCFNGGRLSDFRIYSTTLSADDIKELYTVGASIDNHGNLFCGEVVE